MRHTLSLMTHTILILLLTSELSGCAVNPVTGKTQISLVSEQQEIQIGQANYQPSQQSQGGTYYIDPKVSDYIRRVGNTLAQHSDRPALPYEFVVLNNDVPNAWALPGGKIAINLGLLLELNAEAELAAVLGHEIVHAAARHGASQMTKGKLLGGAVQVFDIYAKQNDINGLATQGLAMGASFVQAKYGRNHELESDQYGMKYMSRAGYDLQGAVDLQETFLRLSAGHKSGWLEGLFASHPPSAERLEANKAYATKHPSGKTGKTEYQKQLAQVFKDKPAYDAYRTGLKALQAKNSKSALANANKALKLQPKEGQFHELKGRALQHLGKTKAALSAYNNAVKYNPNYFSHFLVRGLLKKELGDLNGAKQDLKASNQLLPTSVARFTEAEIALAGNDQLTAIKLFSSVAQSQGNIAKLAQKQLALLELNQRPNKYLKTQITVAKNGELFVKVINLAQVDVNAVAINVYFTPLGNTKKQKTLKIKGMIKAQASTPLISIGINSGKVEASISTLIKTAKVVH